MKKLGIVGFGRFGELLAGLARSSFDVHIVESDPQRSLDAKAGGYRVIEFPELMHMDVIFLTVPISAIEQTILDLKPLVTADQLVADFCSVKVYPAKIMTKHLKNCQLLASHPMFGPDSAKNGLDGLRVAMCPLRASDESIEMFRQFWTGHGAVVLQTTPEDHDKDSVYSQAFTYSVAKIILNMDLPDIVFKTKSFEAITQVARFSSNDSEQLFHDMLYYNPYFPAMKRELEAAVAGVIARLDAIELEQRSSGLF